MIGGDANGSFTQACVIHNSNGNFLPGDGAGITGPALTIQNLLSTQRERAAGGINLREIGILTVGALGGKSIIFFYHFTVISLIMD